MKFFKCIIAGSRDLFDWEIFNRALNQSGFKDKITHVICGGARGVDAMGKIWAEKNNLEVILCEADWSNLDAPNALIKENNKGKYNARAGFDRNKKMAEIADAAIVIIKDDSKGSVHMAQTMKDMGKKLFVYEI